MFLLHNYKVNCAALSHQVCGSLWLKHQESKASWEDGASNLLISLFAWSLGIASAGIASAVVPTHPSKKPAPLKARLFPFPL